MSNPHEKLDSVFGIAATIIGTVIGAGFASGQEIMQFFGKFGPNGGFGVVVAVIIMAFFILKVFRIGLILKSDSYQDFFKFIFGAKWLVWIDFSFFFLMLMLVGVMFAGCGALFKELGVGYWQGVALSAALSLAVLFRDLPGLITINKVIIPLMFLATLGIAFFTVNGDHLLQTGPNGFSWVIAAIQFSSYNLILALPVLMSIAKHYDHQRILSAGGWMGALGLGLTAFWIYWALISHFNQINRVELPMVVLAKFLGKPVFLGYVLVIWGEMLTTLLANLFGLGKRLESFCGWPFRWNLILLTFIGIAIAKLGFLNLVANFYPVYGYLSLIILVMTAFKSLPNFKE